MNYRHAFHAGNFADLVKHAALIRWLERLTADPAPLTIVDTHAGAGLYDLSDPAQARSKEAEAGIKRLTGLNLPLVLQPLRAAVAARNPEGGVRLYPGSPALIAEALRPQDSYVACELQPDVFSHLQQTLSGTPQARAHLLDGYPVAVAGARRPGRLFVLIDPPFERPDDYARAAETVARMARAKRDVQVLVWLPLKDLETLDGFARRLETSDLPPTTVAETRLRPLRDPMRMNGCALVAVNPPEGLGEDLEAICAYVADALGDPGGSARRWSL